MTIKYRKLLIYTGILVLVLSILLSGCSLLGGKRDKVPAIEMMVENPLPVKRIDEFVILPVADLQEAAPGFSPNAFIITQGSSNEEIPHQVDDIDNDGEGDEIAMVLNMEPNERKQIVIRYAPEGRAVKLGYDRRTRAAVHPEYEGIGWESEHIAYRIHPDHRNSIGVFGKQEPVLSLDKFAASVADKGYNHLEVWGVNVLNGGESFGCGGFGLWHKDKLVNLDDNVARYTRIIADGPIRSVVQVIYDGLDVGGQKLRVTATYSIFAGQRWTRCAVKVDGADSPVKTAVGLIQSDAGKLTRDEKNGIFYTWGAQSHRDKPDDLGMAVIYPTESFDSFRENDKSGAHVAVLNPGADNEIAYWFMAAWSSGEIGVKKEKEFKDMVSSVNRRLRNPLPVTIMPSKLPPAEQAPQESK